MSPLVSGEPGAMVSSTLKLGISILNGGNSDVQQVNRAYESFRQLLYFLMRKPEYRAKLNFLFLSLPVAPDFLVEEKMFVFLSFCTCAENAGLSEG